MSGEKIIVRRAGAEDMRDSLVHYGAFLLERAAQDYIFLPTGETIEFFYQKIFMPAVVNEAGVFVAELEGELVGSLWWVLDALPLRMRYLQGLSFGQFVLPQWRGKGVFRAMLAFASDDFRKKGVRRVLDMVHIPQAEKSAHEAGFRTSKNIVILDL